VARLRALLTVPRRNWSKASPVSLMASQRWTPPQAIAAARRM